MPKIVDSAERRERIAGAVLAVAAREGLNNVTLRDVAREAGFTTGTVSHYFRDKHELLLFAFQVGVWRTMARLRLDDHDVAAIARLRTALTAVLPLDDERRAICAVWLDFAAQAMVNADMAELIRTMYGHGVRRLVGILQAGVDAGEIDPTLDPELQAEILTSFAVGLAREALVNPDHLTAERQMAMVDAVLARLAPRGLTQGRNGAA